MTIERCPALLVLLDGQIVLRCVHPKGHADSHMNNQLLVNEIKWTDSAIDRPVEEARAV